MSIPRACRGSHNNHYRKLEPTGPGATVFIFSSSTSPAFDVPPARSHPVWIVKQRVDFACGGRKRIWRFAMLTRLRIGLLICWRKHWQIEMDISCGGWGRNWVLPMAVRPKFPSNQLAIYKNDQSPLSAF